MPRDTALSYVDVEERWRFSSWAARSRGGDGGGGGGGEMHAGEL